MSKLDISFKSELLSTYNFWASKVFMSPLPSQKEISIDIPKIQGITQLYKKFTSRPMKIKGFIYGTSQANLDDKIDDLAEFLYSENDEPLIRNNFPDRYYNAQYNDYVEIDKDWASAQLELKFTLNDPFGYSLTPVNETETTTAKNHNWYHNNIGHFYSFPIVTITFHQNQSHIYLMNNTIAGCRFDITKAFLINDVLTVWGKDLSIKVNNVHSPAGFGDGGTGTAEYILFKKGINQLQVGTDDPTINVSVNINYRYVYFH